MIEKKYIASDKMSELVSSNYRVLLIMSRFGIRLGVGEKSVEEVCNENKVHTGTFLSVANLVLSEGSIINNSKRDLLPDALLTYLHNSHNYFLNFKLPKIRFDLIQVLGEREDELTKAVIRYFDEYVEEVRKHMMYEEKNVFPYVLSLITGQYSGSYRIDIFRKHHDSVENRLKEFKQVLIKYYPAQSTNELNGVLFDIFNCENDLRTHNEVEDKLLIPLILEFEEQHNSSRV